MPSPAEWPGSETEYVVYESLSRLGKSPGTDFMYVPRTADRPSFLFYTPMDLAMATLEPLNISSNGTEFRGSNRILKAQLAGDGIKLIFLPHAMLMNDPDWLVEEALQYRDHSME